MTMPYAHWAATFRSPLQFRTPTSSETTHMGEARRRGSRAQRAAEAIKRNKRALMEHLGRRSDDPFHVALKVALNAFLSRLTPEQWQLRRAAVLDSLNSRLDGHNLAQAHSIRVREDEMGWYIFLCEQAIEDPFCTDESQSQRILPFFAGLGFRWQHAHSITGIERKLDEMLHDYRKQPDGHFFELLVALSYAQSGFQVELIKEVRGTKTADMRVSKGNEEYFVECKRMARTSDYSETERNEFLRLWENGRDELVKNGQWIWFKGTFHVEPATLPDNFLRDIWVSALPMGLGEQTLLDNEQAIIKGRLIDQAGVHQHMRKFKVKANSASLTRLIGGDWAPEDASTTMIQVVERSQVSGCEAPSLGIYVENVGFACGFTRAFDSEISIERKARDIRKLLSEAIVQVPVDRPSIIHLAAETMEGQEVERRRNEKLLASMPSFNFNGAQVQLVRFHRLQAHQRAEIAFELDETVDDLFQVDGHRPEVPRMMVAPQGTAMKRGAHWDIYS